MADDLTHRETQAGQGTRGGIDRQQGNEFSPSSRCGKAAPALIREK